MKALYRSRVLVLGDGPVDSVPFEQRYLTLHRVALGQLEDITETNAARGLLLATFPGKPSLIGSYFQKQFRRVCEAGLITIILAKNKNDRDQAYAFRNEAYKQAKLFAEIPDPSKREEKFQSLPWIEIKEDDVEIAEAFARLDDWPPIGSPELVMCDDDVLEPKLLAMLKRAFNDCKRITIRRLRGGKTAEGTFCVFANLDNGLYGPQPMPFFVKIDSFDMIQGEMENYSQFVEPFIPFHLHPSVDPARCVKTLNNGALICDFVGNAAPLRDALRAGQADCAIYSLFEVTLRGLRSHTQNSPEMPGAVEAFLDKRVKARQIEENHPARIEKLRKRGMHRSPVEIQSSLRNHASTVRARQGIYHGDLHYTNVMVRHRDAIVIDFGSMNEFGPLYADPAILEVSLVFGTDEQDDPKYFDAWCGFVDSIYSDPLRPPLSKGDHPQFVWLAKAVRELRQAIAGCEFENKEALIILAGCMLRYARNADKFKNKALETLAENRRAYALAVAYRLCEQVEAL